LVTNHDKFFRGSGMSGLACSHLESLQDQPIFHDDSLFFDSPPPWAATPAHLPPRSFRAMPPQPLVAWTLTRLARALITWVMEETALPHLPNGQTLAATARASTDRPDRTPQA
jgi:hypothetical protein